MELDWRKPLRTTHTKPCPKCGGQGRVHSPAHGWIPCPAQCSPAGVVHRGPLKEEP
jgi:hypothetical protein